MRWKHEQEGWCFDLVLVLALMFVDLIVEEASLCWRSFLPRTLAMGLRRVSCSLDEGGRRGGGGVVVEEECN